MEETLKQGQRTIHYISATKCLYFATKLQKTNLLQLAKTLHHLFSVFFRYLKLINFIKGRIHHTLSALHHQQIIHIDDIRLMNLHKSRIVCTEMLCPCIPF